MTKRIYKEEEDHSRATKRVVTAETFVPAETVVPAETTTSKQTFIKRLEETNNIFTTASSSIVNLWEDFDPQAPAPMLNPDEIGQLVQQIAKHFDALPNEMKNYCLNNLVVFETANFYSYVQNTLPFETSPDETDEPSKNTDNDRRRRFIERLKETNNIFTTASSSIVDLWEDFDPEAPGMLNPDEIGQLVQQIAKHFDALPNDMKYYCLDNLAVFNTAELL